MTRSLALKKFDRSKEGYRLIINFRVQIFIGNRTKKQCRASEEALFP